MNDFKPKYYLVEYYNMLKAECWIGTTIVCAINSAWALTNAAADYEKLFGEKLENYIVIDTVDDLDSETALEFDTYEEAEAYLTGGYGRIYD